MSVTLAMILLSIAAVGSVGLWVGGPSEAVQTFWAIVALAPICGLVAAQLVP